MQHILRHSSYYVSHDKTRTLTNAWLRFMYLLVKLHYIYIYIYTVHIYIYVTFKLLGSNFKAISSHIFQKSIIELYLNTLNVTYTNIHTYAAALDACPRLFFENYRYTLQNTYAVAGHDIYCNFLNHNILRIPHI